MTPCLSKDIQRHIYASSHSFNPQITSSNTTTQLIWPVSLVITDGHFNLPPGFCGYVLVNTYTARPVRWSGWIFDSYCSLKPLCSGMGEVVPARTSPTLLPPSPRTVLSLSCFKVSQCINCRDWHFKD